MSNVTQMSAGDVLDALEKAWKESALVRELTITDTRELYRELEKGERHGPLKRRIDALMFSPDGMRTAIEVKVDVADAQRESWAKNQTLDDGCAPFCVRCSGWVDRQAAGWCGPAFRPRMGVPGWARGVEEEM